MENPNVVAAIGTVNSYIAVVTAPNYLRSNLLFLTPGSRVSAVTKNNQPYVFRLTVNEQQLQQYTVQYLAKNHMKNILLYYVNDDDGQDAANKFEYFANQSGLNLMARRAYEQDIDDYKTVLKNWQLLYQIDALVLYGDLPHVADIIKTARQVGIKAPIIGTPSMFNPELITLAGDAANGVIVPTVGMISSQNSGYINFAKNYQAQYRAMPDYAAIMGYDSVLLLANVIKQAGTLTPSKLIKQLHNANGYQGLLMHYQFDSIGDLRKPPLSLWQIQNEKFVKIFPLSENNKD
ncbi:MAG: ABC transporter substrate-binding protein [Gammaproteobacteria bacterium]